MKVRPRGHPPYTPRIDSMSINNNNDNNAVAADDDDDDNSLL